MRVRRGSKLNAKFSTLQLGSPLEKSHNHQKIIIRFPLRTGRHGDGAPGVRRIVIMRAPRGSGLPAPLSIQTSFFRES
jgi:hypothetical protein